MIDSQLLLEDLKAEVAKLEDDLRAQCDVHADVDASLKAQYETPGPRSARR
ncbi:MAG: hypothetical protein KBA71_16030 [Opitutaceae bacterium]|nr:hypothetical protein [Opitutaceae bacterium]